LFEDFNEELPQDWTVIVGDDPGHTWSRETDYNGQTLDGTPFMFVDSDAPGHGHGINFDEKLKTPQVNASSHKGEVWLSFDHYYRELGAQEGKVCVWDGSGWINVRHYEATEGGWDAPANEEIDITEYANSQLQVRFRFTTDGWDWYWAIDNVLIEYR